MRRCFFRFLSVLCFLFSVASFSADFSLEGLIAEVASLAPNERQAYIVSVLAREPSAEARRNILSWALREPDEWMLPLLVAQISKALIPPQVDQPEEYKIRLVRALEYLALNPPVDPKYTCDMVSILEQVALEHRGLTSTEAMLTAGIAIRFDPANRLKSNPGLKWATYALLGGPAVPGTLPFHEDAMLGVVELIDRVRNTKGGSEWIALAQRVVKSRGTEDPVGRAAQNILQHPDVCIRQIRNSNRPSISASLNNPWLKYLLAKP